MSFLSNKFKLETKSLEPQVAKFITNADNVSICVIPDNSNTGHYATIGANNFSNIEAFFGINNNTIAGFNTCNINFYKDTIVRGNLIVDGMVMTLGLDIAIDRNDLNLTSYNNCIDVGCNVIIQKYQELTDTGISRSSNAIISTMYTSYSNLYNIARDILSANSSEESTSLLNMNNQYDETKFDARLATKSADEIRQGNNKKYIVNDKFASDKLIIQGDLWTSNMQIGGALNIQNSITAGSFYGDGSSLRNVRFGDGTTNSLVEGSNLFFKHHYVGDLASSSNADTSNFVNDSVMYLQDNLVFTSSNYIEEFSNAVHQRIYDTNASIYVYIDNQSNEISTDSYNTDIDTSNIITVSDVNVSNILNIDLAAPLKVYSADTSNILANSIAYSIADTCNYIDNVQQSVLESLESIHTDITSINNNITSEQVQQVYNTFNNIDKYLNNDTGYSNIFESIIQISRDNVIDYIIKSCNHFIQNVDLAYVEHSNVITNLSDEYSNRLISEVSGLSNIIYDNSNVLQIALAEDMQNASNSLISSCNIVLGYFSNVASELRTMSGQISEYISYNSLEIQTNVKTEFEKVIDYDDATSNELMLVLLDTISNQLGQSGIVLSQTSQSINTRVNDLTTDEITEGSSNFYYTEDRFNEFFSKLDYNMIANGTSNRFIVNDRYDSNLYVSRTLYASNLAIYGVMSTIDTDVYQTGSAQIIASNTVALEVIQSAYNQNIMHLYNANDADVLVVKNTGLVGIGTANPSVALDIVGDAKATLVAGDASGLTNVSLADKKTEHLAEGINLYFTYERAGIIAEASNINVSNYILAQSNQVFKLFDDITAQSPYISQIYTDMISLVNTYDVNIGKYNVATSNYFADLVRIDNVNMSNYIADTSNQLMLKLYEYTSNQSNYVDTTSNILMDRLGELEGVQSNWVSWWSNTIIAHSQTSNFNISQYILRTSNNASAYITAYNLDVYQSNYVRTSCNFLLNHIGLSNFRITHYAQRSSNEIASNITVMSNHMVNYLRATSNQIMNYATGVFGGLNTTVNVYSITDVYGGDKILHMNFNNMKIVNNADDNNFMILNRSTVNPLSTANLTGLTTQNNIIAGYESINNWYLNSSNNIYVYNQNDADAKTVLDMMNKEGFVCHFIFRTRYTANTPIYYIGNNAVSYVNIKILYGYLYITLGNGASTLRFYVNNIILTSTWYVVDIICYIIDGQIMAEVFLNRIMQNIIMILPDRVLPAGLLQMASYSGSLSYAGDAGLSMMFGTSNLIDTYEDTCNYVAGGVYTNTYWSSNSYINVGFLAPIIRRCAYDYQSFSNLIFSSYYASNYDYQYSSNIPASQISTAVNVFSDSFVDNRLVIGDRSPATSYFHYVLTEIEANVRMRSGYYFFMLDLQNEVSADILLGKQTDSNLDNYFNVANYYNSNQLLNTVPTATLLGSQSNFTTVNPLYLAEGYYRYYTRMFRTFANRNNNYYIAKYYYTPTWTGSNYSLNNSNIDLRYMRVSDLNTMNSVYVSGSVNINSSNMINNNPVEATSNLYVYRYIYEGCSGCGDNNYGQLGNSSVIGSTSIVVPVKDVLGNNSANVMGILQIACSQQHSLFLHKSGIVYACGNNFTGELGIGNTTRQTSLVQVLGVNGTGVISGIIQVCAAGGVYNFGGIFKHHSLFLEKNDGVTYTGRVFACGDNSQGQLGLGYITNTTTLLTYETNLVPVRDTTGNNGTTTANLGIIQIACGGTSLGGTSFNLCSFFVQKNIDATYNGKVYVCGNGSYGMMGLNTTTQTSKLVPVLDTSGLAGNYITGIIQVSVGANHTLFLHNSGIVYACGANYLGQLGVNNTTNTSKLIQVLGVNGTGTISNIIQISAGKDNSFCLERNIDSTYNGKVYACGYNADGQLGIKNTTQKNALVQVLDINNIKQVSAAQYHTLFLHSNNNVYFCGINSTYIGAQYVGTPPGLVQLFYADNTTVLSDVTYISAGNANSLFVINKPAIANVSNYNYTISHSNLPYSFFAGNRDNISNLLNLQDFKILNNPITMGANYSISNILYTGKDYFELKTTNKVRTNRWQEQPDYVSQTNQYIYYNEGNVGIGNVIPSTASLEINTNNLTRYNNTLINSIKTNNGIWTNTGIITSSDARIKTNIRDIDDGTALHQILQIQPKTYNYIDTSRPTSNVIGFIAQQVRDVIPTAVKLYKEAIPNIYSAATLSADNIITVFKPINSSVNLKKDTSVVLLDANNNRYTVKVQEVISNTQFRIFNSSLIATSSSLLPTSLIFVYGTVVPDFHALDKSYIYTLNVCALQDIYRRHLEIIRELDLFYNYDSIMPARISELTTYLATMQEALANISFEALKDNQKELFQDIQLMKTATDTLMNNLTTYDKAYLQTVYADLQSLQIENNILASSNQQLLKEHNQIADTIRNYTNEMITIKAILQMNNIS